MTTDNKDPSIAVPAASVARTDSAPETAAAVDENTSKSKGSASATSPPPPVEKTKTKANTPLWLILVLLILVICVGVMAFFGWQWQQSQGQQQTDTMGQLEQQSQQLLTLQQQLRAVDEQQNQRSNQWGSSLQGLEGRVEQHSRRLKSLSTTTRDDWLVAEAEYLLRLANQRLLMERGTRGALGLLQSADQILLQLDDAELFSVRDKLSRDIAALKLTPSVDRSGLYLQLSALSEQIMALPEVPRIEPVVNDESATEVVDSATEVVEKSLWQRVSDNFLAAMGQLRNQVRIRHSDQAIEPLLPPDGANYLRQNLRFNLEQAQLAMLREETEIYRHSLDKAQALLRRYFFNQDKAQLIADELAILAQQDVQVVLPSISGSLSALQDYTARLHLLDERAGKPQLAPETTSGAAIEAQ